MSAGSVDRFLVVRLGANLAGLDVRAVREVTDLPDSVSIPGAPEAVEGLVNVRGQVFTLVSGPRLLGGANSDPGGQIVVLSHGDRSMALLVDEVVDLARLEEPEEDTPVPEGMDPRFIGLVRLYDERAAGIVDLEVLLENVFQG